MPGPIRTAPRIPLRPASAPGERAASTDRAADGAPSGAADDVSGAEAATPSTMEHLAPVAAPTDCVSDFVARHTRRPTAPAPALNTSLDAGRSALDVRLDAARGAATITGPTSGASPAAAPTATVALDANAATLDAAAGIAGATDGGETSADGRLSARLGPTGGPSGAVSGEMSHVRHDDGVIDRVDLAADVRVDASGVTGSARGHVAADTRLGAVDVSADARRTGDGLSGGLTAGVSSTTDFGTVDASADLRATPGDLSAGVTTRVAASTPHGAVVIDARGTGRSTGTGLSADGHLGLTRDAAGVHDAGSVDVSLAGSGLRVDGEALTRREHAGGTMTARGAGHLGDDGVRASASYAAERVDDGTRVRTEAAGSGSYDDGRWTLAANATRSDVSTRDGVRTEVTLEARGNASADGGRGALSGGVRTSGPDGTRDLTGSASGSWTSTAGPAGNLTASYDAAAGHGSERTSTSASASLEADATRLRAEGRFARDGRGVDVDGGATLDVDAGGPRGGARLTASGGDAGGRVRYRGSVAADGSADRLHVDGEANLRLQDEDLGSAGVTASGSIDLKDGDVNARGAAEVTAARADGRLGARASGDVAMNDGTVTAGGSASVTVGAPSDPLSGRAEARGSLVAAPDGVRGGGAVDATLRTHSEALVTETSGGAATGDGGPTVRLSHVRDDAADGPDRALEISAKLDDRSGTVRYRSDRNVDGVATSTDARLEVRPGDAELRVHHEGIRMPRVPRVGGRLRVDGGGLVGGGEVRVLKDRDTSIDGSVSVGVTRDRRVSLGGGARFAHGGGGASTYDARVELGRRDRDVVLTGTRDWATSRGRVAIAFAGHMGRASEVRDKGPVSDLPALVGTRRLVLSATKQDEVALGGGVTLGAASGGLMARFGRTRVADYVTHLPPDEAERVLDEQGAPKIPDPADPSSLRVHDALRILTAGDVGMTADLSAFGIGMAGHATLRGEFALTIEKRGETKVRVSVEPRRVLAVGVEGRALVAVAGFEAERCSGLRQTFDLDLSTTAGRAAYQRALEGELPDAAVKQSLTRTADAIDLVAAMNERLPAGVRAVAFAAEERTQKSVHAGFSWTLFSATRESRSSSGERSTALAGVVLHEREARRSTTTRSWLSGTESAGVFAVVEDESKKSGEDTQTAFRELRFGAHFSDDYLRGQELNEILARLRDVFGLEVEDVAEPGRGEKREIELSLSLSAALLEKLGPWQIARLVSSAEKAGADPDVAKKVVRELIRGPAAADRAAALKGFVASQGMPALGAVVRAFPEVGVEVRGEATGYENARKAAREVLAAYAEPVGRRDIHGFVGRYRKVSASLEHVRSARRHALEDPFVAVADRASLAEEMEELEGKLEGLLQLDHLSLFDLNVLRSAMALVASIALVDYAALEHIDFFRAKKGAEPR